jgi:hypothetical protein
LKPPLPRREAEFSLMENLRWGVFRGAGVAALFTVFVLILAAIPSSTAFERAGVTLGQTICIYWFGAGAGGLILGACRPLLQFAIGKFITGILIMYPIIVSIELATESGPIGGIMRRAVPWAIVWGVLYTGGLMVEHKYSERRRK